MLQRRWELLLPPILRYENGSIDNIKKMVLEGLSEANDMADIVRLYSKKPEAAEQRLANLLSEFFTRIPIRYRTTTGVMIYLHARSISSVPIV